MVNILIALIIGIVIGAVGSYFLFSRIHTKLLGIHDRLNSLVRRLESKL